MTNKILFSRTQNFCRILDLRLSIFPTHLSTAVFAVFTPKAKWHKKPWKCLFHSNVFNHSEVPLDFILPLFYQVKNRQCSIIMQLLLKCYNLFFVSNPYYGWFITNHELLNCCSVSKMDSNGYVLLLRITVFNLLCGC